MLEQELQEAVLAQLVYMKKTLPFDNLFLKYLMFMDPARRLEDQMSSMAMKAARETERFSEEELQALGAQFLQYQSLGDRDEYKAFIAMFLGLDICFRI